MPCKYIVILCDCSVPGAGIKIKPTYRRLTVYEKVNDCYLLTQLPYHSPFPVQNVAYRDRLLLIFFNSVFTSLHSFWDLSVCEEDHRT